MNRWGSGGPISRVPPPAAPAAAEDFFACFSFKKKAEDSTAGKMLLTKVFIPTNYLKLCLKFILYKIMKSHNRGGVAAGEMSKLYYY